MSNKVGEAYVEITADTSKFKRQIKDDVQQPLQDSTDDQKEFGKVAVSAFTKAGDAAKGFSTKLTDVGKNLSLKVTAPIVALGTAAFKTSADFETGMAKIVGLVGIATEDVDKLAESVLALSGETAKAPQELADGMFVITSAGLRGADAVDALTLSAKASAAGLGETNDIARAVAGAMNAYGSSVVDAAKATDVIVATARAGNFETSQFSAAIGRVLPFAKQAGASIEDMGGAVALLTRTNGDAAQSVTQIQALFRAFVVPTEEAKKAFSDIGMSAADFRKAISEDGLPAALELLDAKLGGNREQLGRLLGSSEAASAAFQILDADAEAIAGTFGVVNDSVGMTQEAFDVVSETSGFSMKQAFTDLKVALISFGDLIAPTIAGIAEAVSGLTERLANLDDGTKRIVIGVGLLLAALGPGLLIVGRFASMFGTLFRVIGFTTQVINAMKGATVASTAATKVATIVTTAWSTAVRLLTLAMAANPIGMIVVGIGVLIGLIVLAYKRFETFRFVVNRVINFVIGGFEMLVNSWVRAVNGIVKGINKFTGLFSKIGIDIPKIGELAEVSFGRLSTSADKATDSVKDLNKAEDGAGTETTLLAGDLDGLNQNLQGTGAGASSAASGTDKMKEAVKKLRSEIGKGFETALKTAQEQLKKAKDSFNEFADSVSSAVTSLLSFGDAQKTSVDNNKSLTDAIKKQQEAQTALNEAYAKGDIEAITKAEKELADATNAVTDAQQKPMTFFDSLTEQARKTQDFSVLVNRLLAAGLSEQALQQVLDAGVDAGSAIANEILNTADGVLQANQLVAQVQSIGNSVGVNAAGQFRQAGVDTAQALVDGINSVINNYTIKLKSKKLTDKQLKKLKKQFQLDVEFVMGAGVPELANGAIVNSRTPAIIGEAGAEAVIPITRPARALQLMEQTGLASLARGTSSAAVNIENATFVAPIDADLVAQKVLVAERARSL